MTTVIHRAIELAIGSALVGYCAYSIYTGSIRGKFRSYSRSENPWSFWISVLLTFLISLIFLLGLAEWRK